MDMRNLFENTPACRFQLRMVSHNLYQVIAPIFHEDGDMMTMYVECTANGSIRISDQGMSLMRLSYLMDIDTDNKRQTLEDLIISRDAQLNEGNIILDVRPEDIYSGIMSYAQLVAGIESMSILSRGSTIASKFYEMLAQTIVDLKLAFTVKHNYRIPATSDLLVDYAIFSDEKIRPIYLFGVRDTNKAQQTAIICLQLVIKKSPHRSVIVFDDMDKISRFARNNLVDTATKTFSTLDGFREKGAQYLSSELLAG